MGVEALEDGVRAAVGGADVFERWRRNGHGSDLVAFLEELAELASPAGEERFRGEVESDLSAAAFEERDGGFGIGADSLGDRKGG